MRGPPEIHRLRADASARYSLYTDVVNGTVDIVAEQLPAFLFPVGQKNDRTVLVNLLTGEIMIQAAKILYHGPSALNTGDGCRGSGKEGHAELLGLTTFTPRLIAYIACQVRFALSSVGTYNHIDGRFNYDHFFNYILKAMRRQDTEERVIALFNRRVLGEAAAAGSSDESASAADAPSRVDPLEALWAAADSD
uniref:Uncharacterized protein n=1 Tax=Mycena chlorophos TaxID=658473 RepID=A0ABQ0L2V7_MYCCL|nr:predicted protein [Mycena chlorophos]